MGKIIQHGRGDIAVSLAALALSGQEPRAEYSLPACLDCAILLKVARSDSLDPNDCFETLM